MLKNKHHPVQNTDITAGEKAGLVEKIAPAVALLLIGESAFAGDDDDDSPVAVPEPGSLALLTAGVVAAGTVKYIRKKRRK